MLKSWVKYTLCFVVACSVLASCWIFWVVAEVKEAWWVVERFGGINVVNDESVIPEGIDDIYMRSLYLKSQQDVVYYLGSLEPCREYSQYCMIQESAVINLHLNRTGVVLEGMNDFFEKYKTNVEFFEGGCPVVYETTAVIKEVVSLFDLPAEKARFVAREKMEKIKSDGGLSYSLATPACKDFFRKKPYMARGYIGHLTFLMEVAEGRFSASWRYLGAVPSIQSTLAVMPSKR